MPQVVFHRFFVTASESIEVQAAIGVVHGVLQVHGHQRLSGDKVHYGHGFRVSEGHAPADDVHLVIQMLGRTAGLGILAAQVVGAEGLQRLRFQINAVARHTGGAIAVAVIEDRSSPSSSFVGRIDQRRMGGNNRPSLFERRRYFRSPCHAGWLIDSIQLCKRWL